MKWLHILSAAVWTGGLIVTTILNRRARGSLGEPEASHFMRRVGQMIALPLRLSLYLAMATGLVNAMNRGVPLTMLLDSHFLAGPFGQALLLKLILAPAVLVLAIYHTRVGRFLSRVEEGPHRASLRRRMVAAGWLALLLTLALTALGSILRFT